VPPAADCGQNARLICSPDRGSNVVYVSAACDDGGLPGDHSIPNRVRLFVTGVAEAQKIASKLTSK
jgi:hypothetical protein